MTKLTAYIRQLVVNTVRDRKGAISIVTALAFTTVLGFAGLGTEASFWYVKQRSMQGAADSAAFAASTAVLNGEAFNSGTPTTAAKAIAAQYGYTDSANGVTVSVNSPPSTGPNNANANAVEVIISQPQTRMLSAMFLGSDPQINGRAVALSGDFCTGPNCGCILALNKGNVDDLQDTGNSVVNIPGCSMIVNSDDPTCALTMGGKATINAYSSFIVGGDCITGQAQLNDSHGTFKNTGTPYPDPYAADQIPAMPACSNGGNPLQVQSNQTIGPPPSAPTVTGVGGQSYGIVSFCGGIDVNAGATLTLQPGVYIMNGGTGANNSGFTVNGNGAVVGDGVTIILTGSGTNYATVQLNGSSIITLNTGSIDPTQAHPALDGLTFFGDSKAPAYSPSNAATTTETMNGGTTLNINGGIYFPKELVNYTGGATAGSAGAAACTQLVAYQIHIGGNTNFGSDCQGTGVAKFSGTATVQLVE